MEKEITSNYFNAQPFTNNENQSLLFEINSLNSLLNEIVFSRPVEFIYNPTEYAYDMYKKYVDKFCGGPKTILYLGMNPGPWGMSQTGIPFGEVAIVKNWLQINGIINKPQKESEARPILGLDCHRSEISGKRFWSLFQELCGEPEGFFRSSFVHNYCPIQLMTVTGKNITPAELKKTESAKLYEICDESLRRVVSLLNVQIVVGVGKFAETRANKAFKGYFPNNKIKVLSIPHPSPRTLGNTNWNPKAIQSLTDLDLLQYYR